MAADTADARRLKLRQLDVVFSNLRPCFNTGAPPSGWTSAIRTALGMTTRQLAQRMGRNQSTIARLERSEAAGRITISSLNELARALDSRLVYAIIPNKNLEDMLRRRVQEVASDSFDRVAHSMALEDQTVATGLNEIQLRDLVDEMMKNPPADLWETSSTSR